jgi:hypothetical protein
MEIVIIVTSFTVSDLETQYDENLLTTILKDHDIWTAPYTLH